MPVGQETMDSEQLVSRMVYLSMPSLVAIAGYLALWVLSGFFR
jgi:hypothetical protein